ncbi:MAG: hypothetical protein LBN95_05940 [Prevotellaceae bacterium]|jgi:hypothetical protein|nr:hypothetical protein [Prevotellaceae bacterium]
MKQYIYFLIFVSFILNSCKQPDLDNTFSKVEATYFGRTEIGTTFETTLDFYNGEKKEATIVLWSFVQDIESGVYIICPDIMTTTFGYKGVYLNNTFSRTKCKWNEQLITGGTITVSKDKNTYTFILDLIDNKGNNHKGKYNGKVSVIDKSDTSPYNGMFVDAFVHTCAWYGECPSVGGLTYMGITAGDCTFLGTYDKSYVRKISMVFTQPDIDDPTGTYNFADNCFQHKYVQYSRDGIFPMYQIVSGTLTIERVDKSYKFKICVDYVDETGDKVSGCFDGGLMSTDYE